MHNCKPRATPSQPIAPTDSSEKFEPSRKYREVVGSLIYAMTCTRPDLSWTVTKLSQCLNEPTVNDWTMVKHVFRYLKGTSHYKLVFRKMRDGVHLEGFSDSDCGGSHDRRSMSGYYFSLNPTGPAVSWKSRKQPTVALSTCEAEYMAFAATIQEAIFLRMLIEEFICHPVGTIRINGDNQGAISLVKNPVFHNRSKHIDIKYNFIREKHSNGEIELVYVPSESNIADIMTKPSTKYKLEVFREHLFGKW